MIPVHRPALRILSQELLRHIVSEALRILENIGISVEHEGALRLLGESSATIDNEKKRAYLPEELVRRSLATAPSSVKLYDRDSNLKMDLGRDNIHFVPGSAALYIRDSRTQSLRKPVTKDYVDYAILVDHLPNLSAQSTALVPSDVPESIGDRYRLYLSLVFGKKPIVTGTFVEDGFRPMLEMLVAVRGSKKSLVQRPLAIFDICPSPPLKWSDLGCQSLIDCATHQIPCEIVAMPLAGATAPVTLSGCLVQHTAEALSGIVLSQLVRAGAPVIYGGSPAIFDMREGTTPMGAIETLMVDCACTQIGKHLSLPTHSYMGLSDSKTVDSQTGLESGIGTILAALSGVNLISGAGMLALENCQSLEKLVLDNEVCGMARRLVEGVAQRDEPMAEEVLRECIAKGELLSNPHTLKWFKEEFVFPGPVIDRKEIPQWEKEGCKSSEQKARAEVAKILSTHRPPLLDEDAQKELKKIMERDAKHHGVGKLPGIEEMFDG